MDLTKSQNPDSMVLGSAKIELSTQGIEIDKIKKSENRISENRALPQKPVAFPAAVLSLKR